MANLSNINGKFVVEQTTGYIGVGTTNPSYLLHMSSADIPNGTRLIIENTNASGKEYGLIADNTGVFSIRDLSASADRLSISSSGNSTFTGNVNVGTGLAGTVNVGLTDAYKGVIEYLAAADTNLNIKNTYDGAAAAINFQLRTSGTTVNALTLLGSGNVGIGTTSPRADASTIGLTIGNTTTGGAQLVLEENTLAGGWRIFNNGYLGFIANNDERMRITSGGDVYIGNSAITLGSTAIFLQKNGIITTVLASSSTDLIQFYQQNTGGLGTISRNANGICMNGIGQTNQLVVADSGNVGIGTTSPSATEPTGGNLPTGWTRANSKALEIAAPDFANSGLFLRNSGSTATGTDITGDQYFGDTYIDNRYDNDNGSIYFRTKTAVSPQIRMAIKGSGNVGIGMTAPDARLNVEGVGQANNPTVAIDVTNSDSFNHGLEIFDGNLTTGETVLMAIGHSGSTKLTAIFGFIRNENSLDQNLATIGFWGADNKLTVSAGGNVGIGTGTTIPSSKLHVVGNVFLNAGSAYIASYDNTNNYQASMRWAGLQLGNNGTNRIIAGRTNTGGGFQFWTNNTNDASDHTVTPNGIMTMAMTNTGKVGIGVTSPSAKLTVISSGADGIQLGSDTSSTGNSGRLFFGNSTGNWAMMALGEVLSVRSAAVPGSTSGNPRVQLTNYSSTAWTASSDESLKENINSIGNVLDKINDYRCIEYNLIDDEDKNKKIGFIAQDWQEDFPQIVEQMEDEKIGMKYTETIPILLKAIQELKAEIELLKNK